MAELAKTQKERAEGERYRRAAVLFLSSCHVYPYALLRSVLYYCRLITISIAVLSPNLALSSQPLVLSMISSGVSGHTCYPRLMFLGHRSARLILSSAMMLIFTTTVP